MKNKSKIQIIDKKKKIILVFLFLCFQSCSTTLEYPIESKKYKNDQVTVQSALNLAMSSYLKGCMDGHKIFEKKYDSFAKCKDKAIKHTTDNIVFILDQGE